LQQRFTWPRQDKPGLSLDLPSFCSQRKRVHQIMEALGLHSFDLEAVALRNKAEAGGDKKKAKGVKRRAAALDAEPTAPTRRSRRLVRHAAL
jgi:hypothetical protein